MMNLNRRVLALAALLVLSGCGKPEAEGNRSVAAAPSPAEPGGVIPTRSKSGIPMVYLPGGEFVMGTDQGNPDEGPAHKVKVSGFMMDTFEVSHEQFTKVQLPNPSHWQEDPSQPVERIRWRDAKNYCNERSALEGLKPCYDEKSTDWTCDHQANGYRLPTEAEWEYACRAGGGDAYDFGAADKLRLHSWFTGNADQKTHPAGQKRPNRWGIHDLYGNVSEWCEDVYSPTYYKESTAVDPTGPPSPGKDVKRVIRGGSWKSSPEMCRATFRQAEKTGDTDACFFTDFCGFRCVRRPSADELKNLSSAAK